ncbi:MAG: PAS domain-containing protein, partial [Pseudomonadota bacterium]|nr:PAS domain-containing protein [Pseudomonadota bacterium]
TLVAAAYVGGLLTLTLALLLADRLRTAPADEGLGQPDWSVTHAAIENRRRAIAITDRANRVTCANTCYEEWFGGEAAPMELGFDAADREKLAGAARAAWRDGDGAAESLAFKATGKRYSLKVHRSGRGEDYLVWRFSEIVVTNSYDGVAERISGPFGYMMSRAGIEVALVASDGVVMAHTPGLAMRATGKPEADLKGSEFVQLLRTDDRDRIYFAREGQQGTPQTLVQISLEPDRKSREAGSDPAALPAPSTMVLIDGQVGIGNRTDAGRTAAVPQLEALLAALPLGLALTDRDGRFLFANKAFLRAIEREQEGLPQYPSDLVVREDKGPLSDTVRRFARGSAASGDMAVRLAGDKEEPISLGLAGVRGLGDAAVLLSLSD